MKTSGKSEKDDLTVLVFKNNSSARTFAVPSHWISQFGLITGLVISLAILSFFIAIRSYWLNSQNHSAGNPAYLMELEQKIAQFESAKKALEQPPQQNSAPANPLTQTENGAAPQTSQPPQANPQNTTAAVNSTTIFSALPPSALPALPTTEVPISITEPKIYWRGRTLKVQFFIQYSKEDKGNQQGRILLLARGAETLLTYPAGILNTEPGSSLLAPEKGEYFSVSRIREVKADFGPMKSPNTLQQVEVFIVNVEGKLLVHQFLTPETHPAPTETKAENEDN